MWSHVSGQCSLKQSMKTGKVRIPNLLSHNVMHGSCTGKSIVCTMIPNLHNVVLCLGVLFSGVSVVQAVCSLLASVIYNLVYPATREVNPGLCFFIMSAALTLPFILTL